MSKEDQQRVLATNRLLEILRAERNSEDDSNTEESATGAELLNEDDSKELQYVSQAASDQEVERPEPEPYEAPSLINKENEPELEPQKSFKETPNISESNLLSSLTSLENEIEDEETLEDSVEEVLEEHSVDEDVAKLAASLDSDDSDFEQPSHMSQGLQDDLLLKTELPKETVNSGSNDIMLPPEFNDSLITFYDDVSEEPDWKSKVKYLRRYFADNKRKITLYIDSNTIYLLQTYVTSRETIVEKAKSYSLPFEYGKQVITGINDLLGHILESNIETEHKKNSFGAYLSMKTPSKTIIVKSPKLKKKELAELIEMNANKNLPFSTENKNVTYKIVKAETESEIKDVVVGVTETDSVNSIENIFSRNKVNLRYTSTLAVLLWKSFVKNYPDRNTGTYVLIHLGEARTLVIVVSDHILQFTRKIALGAQDFYKAILKKVEINESGEKIDLALAIDVLTDYGYPQNRAGLTANSNIDINKITMAVRPVVERINSELNRTLNYFKNQKSDLEWKELLFSGMASSFPGLLEAVQENIYQNVELLNPMRTGEYTFEDDVDIRPNQYPNYVLNFALASDEAEEFNVSTKHIRDNYRYAFLGKVVAAILALLIPFFLFTGILSNSSIKSGRNAIESKKAELQRLSVETQDYASYVGDIKIVNASHHFLKNDRTYSKNQVKMLRLFSSIVPEEIKLTALDFVNATGLPDSVVTANDFKEHLVVAGFVDELRSVADIYLTDFILQLEKMQYFSNVLTMEKSENNFEENNELFFKLRLDLQ